MLVNPSKFEADDLTILSWVWPFLPFDISGSGKRDIAVCVSSQCLPPPQPTLSWCVWLTGFTSWLGTWLASLSTSITHTGKKITFSSKKKTSSKKKKQSLKTQYCEIRVAGTFSPSGWSHSKKERNFVSNMHVSGNACQHFYFPFTVIDSKVKLLNCNANCNVSK